MLNNIFVSVTSKEGTPIFQGLEHFFWVLKPGCNVHFNHSKFDWSQRLSVHLSQWQQLSQYDLFLNTAHHLMTKIFCQRITIQMTLFWGDKLLTKLNLYVGDTCSGPRVYSEWRFHCSWNRKLELCKTVRVILQTVNHESTCSCYAAGKAFLPTIPTDLQRVSRHCNEVWLWCS